MTNEQTSSLIRRSGDQRVRFRPETMRCEGMALRLAKETKFYCPGCGQVRRPKNDQGFTNFTGDEMRAHEFLTGYRNGSPELEYCPGGTFDRDADRAP